MRVGSRDSVWSEYGANRAPRPTSDLAQAPAVAPVDRAEARPAPAVQERTQQPGQVDAAEAEAIERKEAAKNEGIPRGPGRPLSKEQEAEVQALRQRDAEVRAHEAAHMAAAGAMGGGASFDYQIGPDGRHYAVGGEVPVRTGSAKTPEEAIRNAAQLRAAALAPAQPSAQDRAVAAEASAMEAAARAEIAARRTEDSLRSAEIAMAASSPDAAPIPVDPSDPEATQAKAAQAQTVAQSESAQASERERMLQNLESEQRYQRSGWRHLHSDSGCGSCSSAVAAYR
jgi:hypothetical protein